MSADSTAQKIADEYASGERDPAVTNSSGKQRSKLEQVEHKKTHPEGDTRRMVQNAMNGEENRREEERSKTEKKERKPS